MTVDQIRVLLFQHCSRDIYSGERFLTSSDFISLLGELRELEEQELITKRVAEAQAEVSFKAGREAGIREVVEWVNLHKFIASPWNYYEFSDKEWQNKLKEWKLFEEVHAACGEA